MAGVYQIFVRFSGCNLRCSYCDTPEARNEVSRCRIFNGLDGEKEVANPLAALEVADIVSDIWHPRCHSVSLTGGEPLQQAVALLELLKFLVERKLATYLETNGTLYEILPDLLPLIDWIAMDVKLPSSQGGLDLLEDHRRFLRLAKTGRVFLKIVIEENTGREEFRRACGVMGGEAPGVPMVLQPVTPRNGGLRVRLDKMALFYGIAAQYFEDVRVIPQMHVIWGAR